MLKKTYGLASVGAAMLLAISAPAVNYNWTGGVGDWDVAANWNAGAGPVPDSFANDITGISGVGANVTLPSTYTAIVGTDPAANPPYNMIFGPEFGATLNIYGTLLYDWYLAPVQWDSANRSHLNMYDDSYLAGEGIALGATWWWNGGPFVTMDMSGNSYAAINWMFWGGVLNLNDNATMDIAIGLTVDTVDAVSDATRRIFIGENAKLILPQVVSISGTPTNTVDVVNDWVSRNILRAEGDVGYILTDNSINPGKTTVYTSLVPEPTSIALLGMGGLFAWVLRRRSNT